MNEHTAILMQSQARLLRRGMKRRHIGAVALARRVGISPRTVRLLMDGKGGCTVGLCGRIFFALGMRPKLVPIPSLATLVRDYLAAKDALFLGTDWLDGRRLWEAWHKADVELRRAVQGTAGAAAATERGGDGQS